MSKELESNINQLQLIQQSLQQLAMQRQQFQMQLDTIDSAIKELEHTPAAYKIIGGIMIATDKAALTKDLQEKKSMIDLRIKNIEKQEERLTKKTQETQKKVVDKLKK